MANGHLTAEDYQGLDPKQIATIRQLGRQDRQLDVQSAQAIAQEKRKRVQQKMKAVSMAIDAKVQKRKNDIAVRKADAYEKAVEAQRMNAEAARKKQERLYEKLQAKQERMDNFRNRTVKTGWGEMSALSLSVMQKDLGLDVPAWESPKVLDSWQDDEGNVKYTIIDSEGKIDTTDSIEGIAGFEKMAEKETVQLGPGEKTMARERAKQRADITSPDFVTDAKTELKENNFEYFSLQQGADPENPLPEDASKEQQKQASKQAEQKAKRMLRGKVGNNIKNIYSDRVSGKHDVVFAEDGPKGKGFYLITPDKDPEYLRGDVK